MVTAVIALFGAWTLTGLGTWSNPTLVSSAIGLAAGIVLGGVVILADRSIGRSLARHVRGEYRKKFASPVRPASAAPTVRPAGAAATSNAATQRRLLVRRPSVGNTATSRSPRALLFWLIAVAVSEEWLYRGVIVEVARSIGGINEELLLIYATVMFALIHVTFGWIQVAAKLPLALATLSVVLVFHSLLPAVIIHVAFNLYFWRVRTDRSRLPPPAPSGPPDARRTTAPAPIRRPRCGRQSATTFSPNGPCSGLQEFSRRERQTSARTPAAKSPESSSSASPPAATFSSPRHSSRPPECPSPTSASESLAWRWHPLALPSALPK